MRNVCASCDGKGQQIRFSDGKPEKCWGCGGTGFDCRGTDDIVCPFCGEESEGWEINESGVEECGHCEKRFHIEVNFSKDFTSIIQECLNDESKHEFKSVPGYEERIRDGKRYMHCSKCHQYKWFAQQDTKPQAVSEEETR